MKPFLLAAAAALLVAAPAQAQVPAPTPTPETFFFDCNAENPFQNLTTGSTSWSPTAPTASYQTATGCLHLDPGLLVNDPATDMFLGGTYAGEVRQLELTLFSETAGSPINETLIPKNISLTLTVDGEELLTEQQISAPVEAGNVNGGKKYTFVVPDLDIPASATPKTYTLQIGTYYSDDFTVWTWGAKEFPASISFLDSLDLPAPDA